MTAHVLSALGNVGAKWRGFSAPEPVWEFLPFPGHRSTVGLAVGATALLLGPLDAVDILHQALRRLPPDPNLPTGAMPAAVRHRAVIQTHRAVSAFGGGEAGRVPASCTDQLLTSRGPVRGARS